MKAQHRWLPARSRLLDPSLRKLPRWQRAAGLRKNRGVVYAAQVGDFDGRDQASDRGWCRHRIVGDHPHDVREEMISRGGISGSKGAEALRAQAAWRHLRPQSTLGIRRANGSHAKLCGRFRVPKPERRAGCRD